MAITYTMPPSAGQTIGAPASLMEMLTRLGLLGQAQRYMPGQFNQPSLARPRGANPSNLIQPPPVVNDINPAMPMKSWGSGYAPIEGSDSLSMNELARQRGGLDLGMRPNSAMLGTRLTALRDRVNRRPAFSSYGLSEFRPFGSTRR